MVSVDSSQFREALSRHATGVTIITAVMPDGRPAGMTVSAFSSLSLDPPLVLVCPAKTVNCLKGFTDGSHFAVNVLSNDQQALSVAFSSPIGNKFEQLDFETWDSGVPIIKGCVANLECSRQAIHDGGDHLIVVGRVDRIAVADQRSPLIYWRGAYRRLSDAV